MPGSELRSVYFDCFSGASGDMILGALVDAGLPVTRLRGALRGLRTPIPFTIRAEKVRRSELTATKVTIATKGKPRRYRPTDLMSVVRKSRIPDRVKKDSLRILERLFAAERSVHGHTRHRQHLDQIGEVDTLVDVVGSVLALHLLGIGSVSVSSLALGTGGISGDRKWPAPPPATAALVAGWRVVSGGDAAELLTPTGAAILTTLGRPSDGLPALTLDAVGYGAGERDRPGLPNALRVWIGRTAAAGTADTGTVAVLEASIDDMNPQLYGPLSDRLFAAGALDVTLTSLLMKKGRPGTLVTVVAGAGEERRLAEIILRHSTTFGVRWHHASRTILSRRFDSVRTEYGPVRVKVGSLHGQEIRAVPEFEDCASRARLAGVPVAEVIAAAARAALRRGKR